MIQHPLFIAAVFVVAVLGGAIAALSGFGMGSLLTPLLANPEALALKI